MIVLHRSTGDVHPCAYLPDRDAALEYELVADLTPDEYERRMDAGWRKFGAMLFHPVCRACDECRPLRIPTDRFTPDRSQRRALARNADLSVRYAPPTVDAARLDLYRRYHAAQTDLKNWPASHLDADDYAAHYVHNPLPALEISAWEGDTLRAVSLTDVTPNVVSGVYHYHDPACRDRSLGTFIMLHTIELARRLGRRWSYFGFYVAGCPSMSYKTKFRPCQILTPDGLWQEWTGA